MNYTKSQIESAVLKKNYVWFDGNNDFDLNIVGIRNMVPGNNVTNLFDDTLTVSYKEKGVWKIKQYPFTTDPGKRAMLNFNLSKGVARVVEGQYRSAYELGFHQGKYEALVQRKPISVYRDNNKI